MGILDLILYAWVAWIVAKAVENFFKWLTDAWLFRDAHAARAELRAVKAELDRLRALVAAWNALQSSGTKQHYKAFSEKYQPPGYWKTLGIKPTKDKSEILSAFRKQAQKAHPDKGGSAQAFQALFEARNAALREIGA